MPLAVGTAATRFATTQGTDHDTAAEDIREGWQAGHRPATTVDETPHILRS